MLLTLVVPSYNEEQNVRRFYEECVRTFEGKIDNYELVYVDDGSRDGTYAELCLLNQKYPNVKVLSFSRNFGKESAIYAGLKAARGDIVCLIDADLQQHPRVVLEMLEVMNSDEHVDAVCAYQDKRKEGKLTAFFKSCFYKLIGKLSDVDFKNGASDFRLMKRKMVDAILSMTEYQRFSKGIFSYVGFNTRYIPYVVEEREFGVSKWSIRKLVKYALDGIISFSTAPLKISTYIGLTSSLGALIYLTVTVVQKLAFGIEVPGYASIVVLVLLLGGLQLFCLGIMGSYIAKMHIELKKRPIYILTNELKSKNECEEKTVIKID